MSDEQPAEKKKGGWPKGKPRGPRKPAAPEPPTTPAPAPPTTPPLPPSGQTTAPAAAWEPVQVFAIAPSGQAVKFNATDFTVENGRYHFISYPEPRGFKKVTILRVEQLSLLEITAPEQMMERLKPPPIPVSPGYQAGYQNPSDFPSVSINPLSPAVTGVSYMSGDPRARALPDPKANRSANIPSAGGPPIPRAVVSGDDGRQETVGASMV